jgi:hypothetical protein
MARCLSPLLLDTTPTSGPRPLMLRGVRVKAYVLPLALVLRLDPDAANSRFEPHDATRARTAGRAIADLELARFRTSWPLQT